MYRAAVLLLLVSAPILAQDAEMAEGLDREAGLEIAFRNPSPPTAKLSFSAVRDDELNGRKLIRYSISVSGLTQKGPYILMTWDIGTNAPIIDMQDVTVDEKGTLRCGDKKDDCPGATPGAALVVGLSGMIGQPRRFVLTTSDKAVLAIGEAVPFPALGTDSGCNIEVVLLHPNGSVMLVTGRGFSPGEAVKYTSSSPHGESLESNNTADQAGNVSILVLPFVKGHDDGTTSVTFTGSKCHPTTQFNWGAYREEMTRPALGQD
jgi:hypothetical protein